MAIGRPALINDGSTYSPSPRGEDAVLVVEVVDGAGLDEDVVATADDELVCVVCVDDEFVVVAGVVVVVVVL